MTDNGERDAVAAAEEAVARAERAERRLARTRRVEFAFVVVSASAALSAMLFSGWNSLRTRQFGVVIKDCTTPGGKCYEQNRKASTEFRQQLLDQVQRVGECQTLQLLQHRDANERAHALNAAKHGYPYLAPAGEAPPPIPDQLKEACKEFIPANLGGEKKDGTTSTTGR